MICKKCQSDFEGNFCPKCGTPANPQQQIYKSEIIYSDNQGEVQIPQKKQKIKKPIYKKWWFWVIIVFIALIIIISSDDSDDAQASGQVVNEETSVSSEVTTAEEENIEITATTKTTTTEDPAKSEEEFKSSCEEISFDTLARNPDKYKGKRFKFTGEVIQVSESSFLGITSCDLRINVTEGEYMWEDTIYATVTIGEGEDRILEDDIITIWGTCDGNYTYQSVLGSSISLPCIDIEYFTIN